MTRIYFLRHAESGNNARHDAGNQRDEDPPITERGHRQAGEVAQYFFSQPKNQGKGSAQDNDSEKTIFFDQYKISKIFVSPMRRTLQTASPLIKKLIQHYHTNINTTSKSESNSEYVSISLVPYIHENGGVFQGERKLSDAERIAQFGDSQPKGLVKSEMWETVKTCINENHSSKSESQEGKSESDTVTLEQVQSILKINDSNSSSDPTFQLWANLNGGGWWRGGRESDADYIKRCDKIVNDLLWSQIGTNCLLITHGKLMDGILQSLCGIINNSSSDSKSKTFPTFLTGGCGLSCVELMYCPKTGERKVGICFLNQPIVKTYEIRTGHDSMGFKFGNEW